MRKWEHQSPSLDTDMAQGGEPEAVAGCPFAEQTRGAGAGPWAEAWDHPMKVAQPPKTSTERNKDPVIYPNSCWGCTARPLAQSLVKYHTPFPLNASLRMSQAALA